LHIVRDRSIIYNEGNAKRARNTDHGGAAVGLSGAIVCPEGEGKGGEAGAVSAVSSEKLEKGKFFENYTKRY
jgi:hypothetical protein